MHNINSLNRRFAVTRRKKDEAVVQSGLAVTPAQMEKMMQNGIPITSANLSEKFFYDGDTNPQFDLPLDRQRGIDIADMWQAERDIKSKARSNLRRDKKIYGKNPQPPQQKGGE